MGHAACVMRQTMKKKRMRGRKDAHKTLFQFFPLLVKIVMEKVCYVDGDGKKGRVVHSITFSGI